MSEQQDAQKESRLEQILQIGYEMTGAVAGASIGLLLPGVQGAVASGVAGPAISRVLQRIGTEVSRRALGPREAKRVGAVLLYAAQKTEANLDAGRNLRQDGFFEEGVDGRSSADEIVEGTLLVSQREYEERKIPFYGKLLGNIGFSAVDRSYANLLLRTGERLSYRQLCLLYIVDNWKRLGLSHRTLRERHGQVTQTEIVALQELVALDHSGLIMDADGTAWLGTSDATVCSSLTEIGRDLYGLMELATLPPSDIEEATRVFGAR